MGGGGPLCVCGHHLDMGRPGRFGGSGTFGQRGDEGGGPWGLESGQGGDRAWAAGAGGGLAVAYPLQGVVGLKVAAVQTGVLGFLASSPANLQAQHVFQAVHYLRRAKGQACVNWVQDGA